MTESDKNKNKSSIVSTSEQNAGSSRRVLNIEEAELPPKIDALSEEVLTESRTLPRPCNHGTKGMFLIREHPSNSLYQQVEYMASSFDSDKDIILASDYQEPFLYDNEPHYVLLTESNWKAGWYRGEHYQPLKKFSLRVRPEGEDGTPQDGRPPVSLVVTIIPQVPCLFEDGDIFTPIYGIGTKVKVDSTGVEHPEELIDRAATLLTHLFNYQIDRDTIPEQSKLIQRMEAYHRFHSSEVNQVVGTLRDSEELIGAGRGKTESHGSHGTTDWIEYKLESYRFDVLGFRSGDHGVNLKVYNVKNPNTAPPPLCHPKIEAAFKRDKREPLPKFSEWDSIMANLRAIVQSHLQWSGLKEDHLIPDGLYYGPDAEPFEWQHPTNRHEELRELYSKLAPEIQKEAIQDRRMSTYDALQCIINNEGASYKQLQKYTGLSYSSVQRIARKLEEKGFVKRIPGAITLVAMRARNLREKAREVLKSAFPGDGEEDRKERAGKRRRQREASRQREARRERQSEKKEPTQADGRTHRASESTPIHFRGLTETDYSVEEIADAIQSGEIDPDDIYIARGGG